MSFRSVFVAVVIGTALLVGAFMINWYRPRVVTEQPTADLIRASGKCAECHANLQYSVVHEYELSRHAKKGVNCLECHQPAHGQDPVDHHGFTIAKGLTAANCRSCHEPVYQQFLRSRHAGPSWAAVYGKEPFTADQVQFWEQFHPGSMDRPANPLVGLEGSSAAVSGCASCHAVGKPNPKDGSVGTCTACHARHTASVELARLPRTCGQCHMGPDHSQIEIYEESKHGVLFQAQRGLLNLTAEPNKLTTRDMFVPTCATCHMSGLNGMGATHDPSERLSYNLFAEVSTKRPNYARGRAAMQDLCRNCHTQPTIDRVYDQAEKVVATTNDKIKAVRDVVDGLRKEGLLGKPFEKRIDFAYFDLWHYDGRTAKHGAYMGGADFVQWHGNYPILKATVEINAMAEEMRRGAHGK